MSVTKGEICRFQLGELGCTTSTIILAVLGALVMLVAAVGATVAMSMLWSCLRRFFGTNNDSASNHTANNDSDGFDNSEFVEWLTRPHVASLNVRLHQGRHPRLDDLLPGNEGDNVREEGQSDDLPPTYEEATRGFLPFSYSELDSLARVLPGSDEERTAWV